MHPSVQQQIYKVIDQEVSAGDFDAICLAQANRESYGNEDVALALYISKRTAMLESLAVTSMSNPPEEIVTEEVRIKAEAFEQRRLLATTSRVKYRRENEGVICKIRGSYWRKLIVCIGNLVLLLGLLGTLLSVMVMSGDTLFSVSRVVIIVTLSIGLLLPWLVSRLRILQQRIEYSSVLFVACVFTAFSSVVSGVILMKNDPSESYVMLIETKKQEKWERAVRAQMATSKRIKNPSSALTVEE